MKISIYRPDTYGNEALPTLYFIHGRTGNERLLQELEVDKIADSLIKKGEIKPLIIVCPNMDNSRGLNSSNSYQEVNGKHGIVHKGRYEDYLINEVIPFIDNTFHTIRNRNSRYIGGISAGGYCALHIGFRYQGLFSRVGGHMPAIDLTYADEDECYFSDEMMWIKYDPISIAERLPFYDLKVFLDDGKDDEGQFHRACERLFHILQQKDVDAQYHLFEGHHDSEYIVSNLKTYLRFYGKC